MIRLTRSTTPPVGFVGERRLSRNVSLVRLKRAGGKPASSVWRRAKSHLKRETHGKCAYCESATSTVAHGDVEHFRPKSVYWWLAYCYDNFSFSCQICNQVYKGDTFRVASDDRRWRGPRTPPPTKETRLREYARSMTPDPVNRADGGMPFDQFVRVTTQEKPYLVDPYIENPEELYGWEADPVLREVRITARTTRVRSVRALRAAEEDLGLNREELRRRRWETYEILSTLKLVVEAAPPPSQAEARMRAANQIRVMMGSEREYAAMARYFVRDIWQLDL